MKRFWDILRDIFCDPHISRIDEILSKFCPNFLDLYPSIYGNLKYTKKNNCRNFTFRIYWACTDTVIKSAQIFWLHLRIIKKNVFDIHLRAKSYFKMQLCNINLILFSQFCKARDIREFKRDCYQVDFVFQEFGLKLGKK